MRRNPVAPVPARVPGPWPGVRAGTGPLVLRNEAEKERKDALRASATVTVRAAKYSQFAAALPVVVPALLVINRTDEIRVSPVFAAAGGRSLTGIVLAGQDIVIFSDGTAWGDEQTFGEMSLEDWEFLVLSGFPGDGGGRMKPAQGTVGPIPARVTSRPRSLAYYDPLLKPGNSVKQDGLPVLQRWAAAIEAVADGVDLVDSLVGSLGGAACDIDRVVDLTLDDVLRSGDVDRMQSWAEVARQLVHESRVVLARRQQEWEDRATAPVQPGRSRSTVRNPMFQWADPAAGLSQPHFSVGANGSVTQNVILGNKISGQWEDELIRIVDNQSAINFEY